MAASNFWNPMQPKKPKATEVKAGPCPRSPGHLRTVVYKIDANGTRRCKCNDCGEVWTKRN